MVKNLLKKVCLVVSILIGLGSNVQAQETSVTFKVSDGGKTLTISGQGDLTTYQTTDFSARVFSDKAVGYVFTDDKGTKVNAGDSYSANNTYYQANYEYTKVCDGEPTSWNGPFGQVTSNKPWKEDKITNLYKGYYSSYNTSVVLNAKVKVGDEVSAEVWSNDKYTDMSVYFLSSKEISGEKTVSLSELESQGVTLISKVELQNYYESNVTYTMRADAFKSSDGGKTYTGLTNGKTYTWTPGEVFYTGTATYSQIKDNGAFFGTEGSHSDYIKADETPYTFAQLLQKKIASGSYETVKFKKASSEDLLINNDIVSKIRFITETKDWGTQINYNSNLKTLDLGAATCTGFSKETFAAADGVYVHGTPALTNLTLPLTNKTSVLSESTGTKVDKMVVPTQVLSRFNSVPTTVTIPEGYDRVGDEAFANSSITNIIFPKSLTLIGESAFENCTKITSITLNEGLENIGKKAFMGTSLTALKFPSTLQIIHDEAFRNCFIYGLKFNAGLKFIGKGAFALLKNEKAETTLEIPASMRYIGAIAFGARSYQDVFFYGENAPLMPFGTIENWSATASAFDEVTLMGNNGFDDSKGEIRDDANAGYANRENYKSQQGVYFCLFHYPKDLKDEQRAAYTDITRVYKTVDEGQTFYYGKNDHNSYSYHEVGQEETDLSFGSYTAPKRTSLGFQDTYLGRQYIWPSQDAWRRSYVVNSLGFNWNGKDRYLPTLSKEDLAVLAYAGYKVADGDHPADKEKGYYALDDLRMMAHMGTRQFVLVNEDVNVDKEPEVEPTYPINIKGGQWWTICVPFDMTKKQVDNVFGEGTHVCRFNKVERVVNSEKKVKSIKLFFTNDVYVHKSTKDKEGHYTTSTGTSVADDDIVIYAHESYMIYPTKNSDDPNGMYNISDYTLVTGSPLPTLVEATELFTGGAKESASGDASWNKEYRFVGNYQTEVAVSVSEDAQNSEAVARDIKKVTVPQYSYIYAKKKKTPKAQFWFYTGKEMLWGANKCVVQATARDGGKSDFNTYFGGNGSARAKEFSFFGKDDEVTGIENVEIIAGNENDTQIVYNLNGQVVNGNLNSLQKGIYIKNGKKFMVK